MDHQCYLYIGAHCDLAEAMADGVKPLSPAFAAMTGHKKAPPIRARSLGKLRNLFQQCIDTGVAGHDDTPARALAAEVRCIQLRGRKEQGCHVVDGDPKIFLGPGIPPVMAAQARFDMRHGNARQRGSQCPAESARRVALNNDERRTFDCGSDPTRDLSNVRMRIGLTEAAEVNQWEAGHAESRRIEVRMLAREDDPRDDPTAGKCFCYG
jgi:hypothetical protein